MLLNTVADKRNKFQDFLGKEYQNFLMLFDLKISFRLTPKYYYQCILLLLLKMKEGFAREGPRPKAISVKAHKPRGNQKFQDLPAPRGDAPYHLSLDDVLSPREIEKIKNDGNLTFHCVGDTGGVKNPAPQQLVAYAMENQPSSFFYHLGDIVYYNGESKEYYPQFYEPYQHYRNPIFAIPGNHDGDPLPRGDEKSLEVFVRNFCATSKDITPDAGEINRSPTLQPNV
jgi:calcineurin-like phosphoesterase family protein